MNIDDKVRSEFLEANERLYHAGISGSINKIQTNYPELYRKGMVAFDELDRIWVRAREGVASLSAAISSVESAERVWREVLTDFKFITGMSL